MDLDELNTSQLILLVLLVSFVTSIATGIVTVSLLAQAPPAITQTVNHVVERTIETVVPKEIGGGTVVTKETTVVVKEEDLVTDSITAALSKTGRVFSGISTSSPVAALAVPVSASVLVTDANAVSGEHLVQIGDTLALFTVSQRFPEIGVALLSPKGASTTLPAPFKIGDTAAVKLGSSAIALVSITNERVALGSIAARFALADVKLGDGAKSVRALDTNVVDALVPGAPLVNVFGDLLGISTGAAKFAGSAGTFVSASDIVALMAAPRATTTPSN